MIGTDIIIVLRYTYLYPLYTNIYLLEWSH